MSEPRRKYVRCGSHDACMALLTFQEVGLAAADVNVSLIPNLPAWALAAGSEFVREGWVPTGIEHYSDVVSIIESARRLREELAQVNLDEVQALRLQVGILENLATTLGDGLKADLEHLAARVRFRRFRKHPWQFWRAVEPSDG